ncbi:MAG: nucleoside-diphosphate sugar epimerase [Chitinophagaceae bacterium]|nr:MAG: nucleoside-diphosphate sugar [Chitinophagaceae bacterium]TXT33523.1 MAG: nucleoside-diphosphate sugar epimerase [Chitinophagaceae bacterium]
MQRTALLLGATGLTGSLLLNLLLQSEDYKKVIIYVRKSTNQIHPKLVEQIIYYDTIETAVEADDVFCCLGTTIKIAKTKEAFEKVDLHYPLKIAALQHKAGSTQFLVVSAMGASASSSIFYSKTKGLMEVGLEAIGFESLYIFRPSFIMGNRKEERMGEKIGIAISKMIAPLMLGPLKNYQPVEASAIAASMIAHALSNQKRNQLILSGKI